MSTDIRVLTTLCLVNRSTRERRVARCLVPKGATPYLLANFPRISSGKSVMKSLFVALPHITVTTFSVIVLKISGVLAKLFTFAY